MANVLLKLAPGGFTEWQGTPDGAGKVVLYGGAIEEQLTDADAASNILTFSEDILTLEIYHEEDTWQDFVVNGITLKVPPGGYRTSVGGTPSPEVTIPATVPCIVSRLI